MKVFDLDVICYTFAELIRKLSYEIGSKVLCGNVYCRFQCVNAGFLVRKF